MSAASDSADTAIVRAFDIATLGLDRCDRLEVIITLYEHETAGLRPESWPEPVRVRLDTEIRRWLDGRSDRVLVAVTYGIGRVRGFPRSCVAVLHHAPKPTPNAPSKTAAGASAGSGTPSTPSPDAEASRVPSKPAGGGRARNDAAGALIYGQSGQAALFACGCGDAP